MGCKLSFMFREVKIRGFRKNLIQRPPDSKKDFSKRSYSYLWKKRGEWGEKHDDQMFGKYTSHFWTKLKKKRTKKRTPENSKTNLFCFYWPSCWRVLGAALWLCIKKNSLNVGRLSDSTALLHCYTFEKKLFWIYVLNKSFKTGQ